MSTDLCIMSQQIIFHKLPTNAAPC